ncbi:MAG: glycosyltransferase [Solirubrobacterales bacterium]
MPSVITPTRNMARFLPDALDSVAALRCEHIVIDGDSGDCTLELLEQRRDPRLVWVPKPDGGQTEAVTADYDLYLGLLHGRGWEGAKRAVLPRISSWPDPKPAGVVSLLRRLRVRS